MMGEREHGRIISVYVDAWTVKVLERMAAEHGTDVERLVESWAENNALEHSTIAEREARRQ